jgi:hypothetical protein
MVNRKRDHLPLKQVEPVQLLFGALMLASKASSTGSTPVQCPFFTFILLLIFVNILLDVASVTALQRRAKTA